jgi:hypothetical protein
MTRSCGSILGGLQQELDFHRLERKHDATLLGAIKYAGIEQRSYIGGWLRKKGNPHSTSHSVYSKSYK